MKKYDGEIMEMADAVEDALLVVRDVWKTVFFIHRDHPAYEVENYGVKPTAEAIATIAAALLMRGSPSSKI